MSSSSSSSSPASTRPTSMPPASRLAQQQPAASTSQAQSASASTAATDQSLQAPLQAAPPGSSSRRSPAPSTSGSGPSSQRESCGHCSKPVIGQFVRAIGSVYHLDCFSCQDCGRVVAAKFFPVDGPNGPYPLCERDYFRRLNLLCASCGEALRGSYITALEKKFHVEHFTCSVCPTVFGPQDSYYEHNGAVYCHFHYSTRFAVRCTGCQIAILKQFVEINRYDNDEHWHPECYMIHKFWNTKLAPTPPAAKRKPSAEPIDDGRPTSPPPASTSANGSQQVAKLAEAMDRAKKREADYKAQEAKDTPASLRNRQKYMEDKVYRIWTVLSTFEESAAACISEMLRFVSNGQYLEGVRMAEKFVLHVETLFASLDDLNASFRTEKAKEMAHVREARMLCKKIVNFFSLLSHTHEAGSRKMGISSELLSLVTGLAHYLKILIRIALTASLRLEREHGNHSAMHNFLNRLDRLARDPEAAKATFQPQTLDPADAKQLPSSGRTDVPVYGYYSLARAVGTLIGQGEATSDLCEGCRNTVEDQCVRFGTSARWHLACLKCLTCGASTERVDDPAQAGSDPNAAAGVGDPFTSTALPISEFRLEPRGSSGQQSGSSSKRAGRVYCSHCAAKAQLPSVAKGFAHVTRLEQYAFLLCVALNKLYGLLKQKGVMQASSNAMPDEVQEETRSLYETYRDSTEISRMKSVNLDRKLSTTMRTPKTSTVIDSPSGRIGQFSGDQGQPALARAQAEGVARPASPSQAAKERPPALTPGGGGQPLVRTPTDEKPPRPPPLDPEKAAAYGLASASLEAPRPSLNRSLTAVKVVDHENEKGNKDEFKPRDITHPTGEDGLTLADLPQAMVYEQALAENRRRDVRKQSRSPRQAVLLSELSALEYMLVKHAAALMLTAESSPFRDVVQFEELMELIEMRKNNFWSKFFKPQDAKKNVKKKGVFGIPLEFLVERGGVESMLGAGAAPLRVPTFIDEVVSAMKQMDMSVEGVFRKNGNIRRLKDLTDALDKDPSSVNLVDDNPVQLAALLKKWLRELPEPLFPYKMHHMFLAAQNIDSQEQRLRVLHLLCCLLPKAHRDTMEVLFIFLKWVATFSHVDEESGSRMDLGNLATVICPNILYSKGKDPTTDNSFAAIRTLHELLEHQDRFWQVPGELSAILENPDLFSNPELTTKDILRACREILVSNRGRSKTNGGNPVTGTHSSASPAHRPDVHPPTPRLPPGQMPFDRSGPPPQGWSSVGSPPLASPPEERPKSFQFFPQSFAGPERPTSPLGPAYPPLPPLQ